MKIYIRIVKWLLLVSLILTFLQGISWAEANDLTINTSLVNGVTVSEPELTFNYTIKYKTENGQLKYKLPEKILVNNQSPYRYGNTYRVTLQEGENKIFISYQDGEDYFFDTYFYHLDTTPPYINADGVYDHMMVNKSHIKFSIKVGDLQSIPEALEVHVYLNDTELKENYGFYQGLLKQSPLLSKKQKIATNDKHPTENIIKVIATDASGNQTIREYHVIFVGETTNFSQLRYLIEKVPGLLPLHAQYDNIGHYSEVGVALDDSNITVLGTYGGYVLLGHDQPIFNGEGDDILVNGHWSNAGYPLTSVWVMKDWNNNQLPDDEWYYLDDSIDAKREIINSKVAYDLKSIGHYKDDKGNNKRIVTQIPVRTAYSTPYFENAKSLNKFDFSSSSYSLYGNRNIFHDGPIKSLVFSNKGYDLDNARTLDDEPIELNSIDFVKVYTNTFDLQTDVGSVMPAVNYVLALHDSGESFACETGGFTILNELPSYDKGDAIKLIASNLESAIQYSQVRPEVNEDYVFVFPESADDNHLPFKVEEETIEIFYPYNRATLEYVSFELTTTDKLSTLTWPELMTQRYYINNRLKYSTLTNSEEGQLELLQLAIEKKWKDSLSASFSKIHNNYDELIRLKWQMDYLEDEAFLTWSEEDRKQLEEGLFKMIDYNASSFKLQDQKGETVTITPVKNVSYNLSKEELERQIKPEFQVTSRTMSADKTGFLSFDLALYKSGKKMTKLYRPVTYQVNLNHEWTEDMQLYYVSNDGDKKISVQVAENNIIQFTSNQLGWFYIGLK
jgi:hypothetical protein